MTNDEHQKPDIQAQNIGIVGGHAHVEGGIHFHEAAPPPLIPIDATAPPPPPHFTDRRAHLDGLRAVLSSGQIAALHGIDGIGKTATACKLAAEAAADFPGGVFWGTLSDHDGDPWPILCSWGRDCGQDLSAEPDLDNLAKRVRGLLTARRSERGPLLVIVDDVRVEWREAAQWLQRALPAATPFLLTTSNEELAVALDATVHHLPELPPDDALNLLKALAGTDVIEADLKSARNLLKEMGHLPLAIELAGKLVALEARQPGYRLADLLQAVAQRPFETLALEGQRGLAAIFAIAYGALPVDVQRVFRWLGVFATGPLHVTHVVGVLGTSEGEAEESLKKLVRNDLLAWGKTEKTYRLHPLLRQYAQSLLAQTGEEGEARQSHLTYYRTWAMVNGAEFWVWQMRDRLEAALPNLLAAAEWAIQAEEYGAANVIQEALTNLGTAYQRERLLGRAITRLEPALAIARRTNERDREATLLTVLGDLYRKYQGELTRANEYYERALAIVPGSDNRFREGYLLDKMGHLARERGDLARARELWEQALPIYEEIGDPGAERLRDLLASPTWQLRIKRWLYPVARFFLKLANRMMELATGRPSSSQ